MLFLMDSPLTFPSICPETAQERMFRLMQLRTEYEERGADSWTMDSLDFYVDMAIRWVKRLEREKHTFL